MEPEDGHRIVSERPPDGNECDVQKLAKVGGVSNHEHMDCRCNSEQDKCADVGQRCEPSFQGHEPVISGLDYAGLKPLQHKAVLALKCESRREAWENR